MAFCPICKMEYREGVTECADCHVALVEVLPHAKQNLLLRIKSERVFGKFKKYLEYSKISVETEYHLEDARFNLYVLPKYENKVKAAWETFLLMELGGELGEEIRQEEAAADLLHANIPKQVQKDILRFQQETIGASGTDVSEADAPNEDASRADAPPDNEEPAFDDGGLSDRELTEEDSVEDVARELLHPSGGSYESMKHKAEDTYGSAVTLILFGALGIVYMFLNIAGILSHFERGFSQCLLLIFFSVLLGAGIYTWRQYQTYKSKADEEEKLRERLNLWMKETFTPEAFAALNEDGLSPEEIVIVRLDWMAKSILAAYPELSENAAYQYADDFYNAEFSADETD
ncbi:MAG: hypothetical protein Q4C48_02550 [Lachnospiraceae bacterium]|nr:hypothetical protein [Lachnospiraceae bacterium]